MKRIAVLSIIGILGVPIQGQAQSSNATTVDEFERRQQEVGRVLRDIAEQRHQMMKEVAKNLRAAEQNAPPTTQGYAAVERDYANCSNASLYSNFGHCQNRRAQGLANCSQGGEYMAPGTSQKDQCLNRVMAEYQACGYRAGACADRWIAGLGQCNQYR